MSCNQYAIKVGNFIYQFYYSSSSSSYTYFKIDLVNNTVETLSSFGDFIKNTFGVDYFTYISVIADSEERYVYLIGGGWQTIGYNHIIKYDTVNDSFEKLAISLLGDRKDSFSVLVDNRVYIFGGQNVRKNSLDYFDLQYPLNQNNAIITIANYKDDNALPLINTEKLKINSNIASAYIGNADNLAEKVNAYYYESQKSNDTYSSVTFDKNTIISNFENITNAINNNGGMLVCSFGGDSENANYTLMISTSDEGIAVIVMKVNENVMIGNIGSDGTLYESFGATPCTWLDGNTNTFAFDNSYELNTVIDGGLPLSTPQELIDLGICTFVINQGGEIGYWKGINCEDYTNE